MQAACSSADLNEELHALQQSWHEVGNSSALAKATSADENGTPSSESRAKSMYRVNTLITMFSTIAISVVVAYFL